MEDLTISWSLVNQSLSPNYGSIKGLPQLRRFQLFLLSPSIEGDVTGRVIQELLSVFLHLPLGHVQTFGVFIEEFVDSLDVQDHLEQLLKAMGMMRFQELKTFHLGFNFAVYNLPSMGLWVRAMVLDALSMANTRLCVIAGIPGAGHRIRRRAHGDYQNLTQGATGI
jgi:hypothetical protein